MKSGYKADPTFGRYRQRARGIAKDIAADVSAGDLDELRVPLALRDRLIAELRPGTWLPALHNHGMAAYKAEAARLRHERVRLAGSTPESRHGP